MAERPANHKPVQTHELEEGGNQVKLIGHHAAEDCGHFSFEALQNQLHQPHNQAAGKPLHPDYAAIAPGKQADA